MYLSIIIPCYNEEKRIGKTLERIHEYMSTQSYEYQVIVIDNGYIDRTGEVVRSFKDRIKNLELITARSHGKGWAIKEGMMKATGEYKLYTDADNATDISQVEILIEAVKKSCDIAIGSRRISGAKIETDQPPFRKLTSFLFRRLVRFIVPLGFKDTQNGFKLFSKRAADVVFPHQVIFYWAFDVEILALAEEFDLCVKEVPIVWVDDKASTMSFDGMLRMLLEVIYIRINLWINLYMKNNRRESERRETKRVEGDTRGRRKSD